MSLKKSHRLGTAPLLRTLLKRGVTRFGGSFEFGSLIQTFLSLTSTIEGQALLSWVSVLLLGAVGVEPAGR
jgi:hypothetical protein